MRLCSRCDHQNSDRAEWCTACGYQIVYTLTVKVAHPRARKPRKPRPVRALPRDRTFEGVGELCELHGADCDPATCRLDQELIDSGLL